MIGHFLLTLTKAEEDRVMHRDMGFMNGRGGPGCLLQVVGSPRYGVEMRHVMNVEDRLGVGPAWNKHHVGMRYDALISRFGVQRVVNAIRSRVLMNQLRRSVAMQQAINELIRPVVAV